MDLYVIWATDKSDSSKTIWAETAWDADSIEGNPDGWEEARSKAYATFGPENVVIAKVVVDFDVVQEAMFEVIDSTPRPPALNQPVKR